MMAGFMQYLQIFLESTKILFYFRKKGTFSFPFNFLCRNGFFFPETQLQKMYFNTDFFGNTLDRDKSSQNQIIGMQILRKLNIIEVATIMYEIIEYKIYLFITLTIGKVNTQLQLLVAILNYTSFNNRIYEELKISLDINIKIY